MACSKEYVEMSDDSLCPICSDNYKAPRRIPTCGHTFCEDCLVTFVFDLKKQGTVNTSFDCPVCSQPNPLQTSRAVVLECIKTFPLVPELLEVHKGSCDVVSEEGDRSKNCGLCAEINVVACGTKFCFKCQTYICDGCADTHTQIKALSNHMLLDRCEIVDGESLLSDLLKYRKCPKHPEREVELYCKDDETFLCLVCATASHKTCTNVIEASENTDACKEKLGELKYRIVETQNHLDTLQHLSNQNITCVKTQTETVEREARDTRNTIVDSINAIVESVTKQTKQIRHSVDDKGLIMAANVERLKALYDKKLFYLELFNKHGSRPDLFMCSTHLEAEVENLEDEVVTLDSSLETSEVDGPISDVLSKIQEQLRSSEMPQIDIINKVSDHKPKYILPKMPSPFQVGKVEPHNVRIIDYCTPPFTGITVDDDGTLVLSASCDSSCGHLCLYKPDQKKKQILKMEHPNSSTVIDKETVASAMRDVKRISVVSLGVKMRIKSSFDTKYKPTCIISLGAGNVAISWTDPPAFSIANISGSTMQEARYLTQDSDGRKFMSFDFIAINESRKLVIQPCHKDKVVYCFDFTGKPVFKYTNNLKTPKGVTVDIKTGSVYVCDKLDACIHQLSARGQPIAVIRHSDLKSPLNVCYDKQRKCLWVTHDTSPYNIVSCFERA